MWILAALSYLSKTKKKCSLNLEPQVQFPKSLGSLFLSLTSSLPYSQSHPKTPTIMSLTVKLHITNQLNLNLGQTSINNKTKFYTPRIRTKPIYHSNPMISTTLYNKPITTMHVPSYSSSIKSSLIDPDGGALVDLVVPERERAKKKLEAEALPPVRLTKIDVEWVHVISEGWASPLRGFMRESEYLQSLHFNCLRMGSGSLVNMSLPIVLAIDDETKTRIGSSPNVGLVGPNGDLVGILRRLVVFEFRFGKYIICIFEYFNCCFCL